MAGVTEQHSFLLRSVRKKKKRGILVFLHSSLLRGDSSPTRLLIPVSWYNIWSTLICGCCELESVSCKSVVDVELLVWLCRIRGGFCSVCEEVQHGGGGEGGEGERRGVHPQTVHASCPNQKGSSAILIMHTAKTLESQRGDGSHLQTPSPDFCLQIGHAHVHVRVHDRVRVREHSHVQVVDCHFRVHVHVHSCACSCSYACSCACAVTVKKRVPVPHSETSFQAENACRTAPRVTTHHISLTSARHQSTPSPPPTPPAPTRPTSADAVHVQRSESSIGLPNTQTRHCCLSSPARRHS